MSERDAFRSRTFARDRRMWLATIAVAGLLWVGIGAWLNRRVTLAERPPAGPGADGRFVVLAFDRVVHVQDGKSLDRLRLREALRALASAGWHAVTLEEVRNAYRGGAPLPARPILLTFDEGYLETYEAADPVLRELRWPAVMFLRTERQETRDVSFLFWDRLQRMRQSGLWELASGDPAAAPVPPAGTCPPVPPGVWLIEARSGAAIVPAWAPRGVEPLVAAGCAAAVEPAPGSVPWLGFMDDPVGANEPTSNPFRIGRLRVDPVWTRDELLRRIDVAVAAPGGATACVPGEGTVSANDGAIRLEGRPRAEVWIPSARWVDDWALELRLRIGSGEFWVVQPADVPGRQWRFGGIGGVLYVQDIAPGRPPEVLAHATVPETPAGLHRVRVVKRGGGVSVTWDGTPLTPAPVALPGRWRGKLGLVAYRADGTASLGAEGLGFTVLPFTVRAVNASPAADEVAALVREAAAIAAVSPAWATIDGGRVREAPFDRDLFRVLARRYAWEILPTVAVRGGPPEGAVADWLAGLPARVGADGYAGIRVDLSGIRGGPAAAWEARAQSLDGTFRRGGMRLVVVR